MTDKIEWLSEHFQTLRAEPGDRFVIFFEEDVSDQQATMMRKAWDMYMPGWPLVVIGGSGKLGLIKAAP